MNQSVGLLNRVFGGGASISVQEAHPALNSYYIIDVRQPGEFHSGHIKGAKLLPLNQLSQLTDTLPDGQPILCVCRSGARSGSAARRLNKAGLNAINLRGGMLAWERAGFPVSRGKR